MCNYVEMNNDFFEEKEVRGWIDCPECPPPPSCENDPCCNTPPNQPCQEECCEGGGGSGGGGPPGSEIVNIDEIEDFLKDIPASPSAGQMRMDGGGGGECGPCKNCGDLLDVVVFNGFLPNPPPIYEPDDPNYPKNSDASNKCPISIPIFRAIY